MWLYLVALVGLWTLLRLFRERQVVSHLHDKYVFITGCDSGFGNLLARQLDRRGMKVLAAYLTENGAEQLRNKTSERLETVILDVTKTESIVAATQWVKELFGKRAPFQVNPVDYGRRRLKIGMHNVGLENGRPTEERCRRWSSKETGTRRRVSHALGGDNELWARRILNGPVACESCFSSHVLEKELRYYIYIHRYQEQENSGRAHA
ncbi:retinol dehydrogenase 7-like [Arvicanthis niloticus]|uniref:retinol dehydrogenase 7-like n=1 Tax=Arvicanthis niloticus TaxID=61156 RepID=UPI00402BEF1E